MKKFFTLLRLVQNDRVLWSSQVFYLHFKKNLFLDEEILHFGAFGSEWQGSVFVLMEYKSRKSFNVKLFYFWNAKIFYFSCVFKGAKLEFASEL